MAKIFDGAADRLRREHNLHVWAAWHTAAWGRTKTLPDLRKLLDHGPRKAQTVEEQEMIVRMMHAALTGETRH